MLALCDVVWFHILTEPPQEYQRHGKSSALWYQKQGMNMDPLFRDTTGLTLLSTVSSSGGEIQREN